MKYHQLVTGVGSWTLPGVQRKHSYSIVSNIRHKDLPAFFCCRQRFRNVYIQNKHLHVGLFRRIRERTYFIETYLYSNLINVALFCKLSLIHILKFCGHEFSNKFAALNFRSAVNDVNLAVEIATTPYYTSKANLWLYSFKLKFEWSFTTRNTDIAKSKLCRKKFISIILFFLFLKCKIEEKENVAVETLTIA